MIAHWVASAWRSLRTYPLFSVITILSLTIGCAGALLAGASIRQHVSFERWTSKVDRIFVVAHTNAGEVAMGGASGMPVESASQRPPQTDVLLPLRGSIDGRVSGLEKQARLIRGVPLLQEDKDAADRQRALGFLLPGETAPAFKGTAYIDPAFFDIFDFDFLEGSPEAINDPDTIIVTRGRVTRLFGDGPALGRTVAGVGGRQLRVIGVIENLPPATHLQFETLAGMQTFDLLRRSAGQSSQLNIPEWARPYAGAHYLLAAPETDTAAFLADAKRELQLQGDIGARQMASSDPSATGGVVIVAPRFSYTLLPLRDLHLSGAETARKPVGIDAGLLLATGAAAAALLLVSAFNFVTLSLARILRRRREAAIRKSLGATPCDLALQYLVEAAVVTGISLAAGLLTAALARTWFAGVVGQPPEVFDLLDPVFLAWAGVGFVVLAVLVGAYPALYLANAKPSADAGLSSVSPLGGIGRVLAVGLLGLQIAGATCLGIVAIAMLAQTTYIENHPIGFDIRDKYQINNTCPLNVTMSVDQLQEMAMRCADATARLMKENPELKDAAAYGGSLFSDTAAMQTFARGRGGEPIGEASQIGVDTSFLQFMGARILAGRLFDGASAFDRRLLDQRLAPLTADAPPPDERVPVIVTRAMVGLMALPDAKAAIGQLISPVKGSQTYEIVGVVDDWRQRTLRYPVLPTVFIPSDARNVVVRIDHADVEALKQRLAPQWRRLVGDDQAGFMITSLEDKRRSAYSADFRLMATVAVFALVAMFVGTLGVYGLAAFEVEQRTREIGIRKALGATSFRIMRDGLSRAAIFIVVASLVAWPLGYWIAAQWLAGFVYHTDIAWLAPILTSTAVALLCLATITFNALRSVLIAPNLALRQGAN